MKAARKTNESDISETKKCNNILQSNQFSDETQEDFNDFLNKIKAKVQDKSLRNLNVGMRRMHTAINFNIRVEMSKEISKSDPINIFTPRMKSNLKIFSEK